VTLHIFRARSQPATRFQYDMGNGLVFRTRYRRRRQLWANCCERRRYAANLVAHVYYDGTWFYCRPDKGCKA